MSSLFDGGDTFSSYSFSSPKPASKPATETSSPAAAAVSTISTAATASFDQEDSTFWTTVRQRELDRASAGAKGRYAYKPAYSASHEQIRAAVLEFIRRRRSDKEHDELPAVLVATKAKRIPVHSSQSIQDLDLEVGKIKFFLDHVGSLFIVSLSAKAVHGTGVEYIKDGLFLFRRSFDHFMVHDDIIQSVPGGTKAPDVALKLDLPRQALDGPLRAPFVAEVRSSSYSTDPSAELVVASRYMTTQFADYFLYLFVEKKRPDGLFPAAAVLWRRGAQPAPLADGQQATFVSAQSFGTGELDDASITCLRNGGGHYPGVPVDVPLDSVQNPADIVIPKADLLRKVMRQDGTLRYQRQGTGNTPIVDAVGNPVFDFPAAGPDLVISLVTIRDKLFERFD